MSFSLTHLLGKSPQGPGVRSSPGVPASDAPLASRREMLRLALRDTLRHCGFGCDWVTADLLVGSSRTQELRLHVRLSIRHWDSSVMLHSMALQEELRRRLQNLDPHTGQWVASVSWQFALPDDADYPGLPDRQQAVAARVKQPAPKAEGTRARLDRLLQAGDAAAVTDERAYASTEPAGLH